MKKVSIFLIIFFLAVSVSGGIYYVNNSHNDTESNDQYDDEALYPEDLRPGTVSSSEESDSTNQIDTQDETEDNTNLLDEILSDENFTEFETEEETVDNTDETDGETTEETDTIESENSETEEDIVTGDEIEIINSKVNIRREPKSGSKILTAVPIGSRGTLLEEGEHWSLVQFGDTEGYLSNKYWKRV